MARTHLDKFFYETAFCALTNAISDADIIGYDYYFNYKQPMDPHGITTSTVLMSTSPNYCYLRKISSSNSPEFSKLV